MEHAAVVPDGEVTGLPVVAIGSRRLTREGEELIEQCLGLGPGLASSPRISMGPDPADDKVVVKSSKGKIVLVKPPERETGGASVIYWRKNY